MSCLLIFAFCDQDGASQMIAEIKSLQKEQLISVSDAATVIRKSDGNIKIEQATSLVGSGALFLIVSSMAEDRIIAVLSRHKAMLLRTNLSQEDENRLREAFAART